MILAFLGFVASSSLHLTSILGIGNEFDFPWYLHVGVFVVFAPVIFSIQKEMQGDKERDIWKVILAGSPVWMRVVMYLLLAYVAINFALFMHKNIIDPSKDMNSVVGGFSGHWLFFYYVAFIALYSMFKRSTTEKRYS